MNAESDSYLWDVNFYKEYEIKNIETKLRIEAMNGFAYLRTNDYDQLHEQTSSSNYPYECCIIIPRKKLYLGILNKKRKRRKRKMPQELMKEFIGKVCTIMLFNASFGVQGKIVAVEENWIKVEEKNKVRIINGDMIQDISILPEKYQK